MKTHSEPGDPWRASIEYEVRGDMIKDDGLLFSRDVKCRMAVHVMIFARWANFVQSDFEWSFYWAYLDLYIDRLYGVFVISIAKSIERHHSTASAKCTLATWSDNFRLRCQISLVLGCWLLLFGRFPIDGIDWIYFCLIIELHLLLLNSFEYRIAHSVGTPDVSCSTLTVSTIVTLQSGWCKLAKRLMQACKEADASLQNGGEPLRSPKNVWTGNFPI